MKNENRTTITGFIWMFLERVGAQSIGLVISFVLARLMTPDDYGVVAIVNVFIPIITMFISAGMSVALVQKKDADDLDFSSLFYFNLCTCVILYIGLFLVSPWIAKQYETPELTAMLRVAGCMFLISGLRAVQAAYCSRHLLFKNFFFATLGGTVIAAVVGIIMAVQGYGAWALIIQSLLNNAIDALILWFTAGWRPKKMFSFSRLKALFQYGWKMLVSSLLELGYNSLSPLIIGYKYNHADLAYYNKGQSIPNSLVSMINAALDKVLLPVMANNQNEPQQVKLMTRQSLRLGTFVLFPLMMGAAVCATGIVRLLLTDKWLEMVPFFQMFCVVYALLPVQTANLNAIKALGRSDLFLKIETVKKVIGIITLIITVPMGVKHIAFGQIVVNVLGQLVNAWPNRKLMGYAYREQLLDVLPSALATVAMGILVYLVSLLKLPVGATLLLQVLTGVVSYVVIALVFRMSGMAYMRKVLSMLKK